MSQCRCGKQLHGRRRCKQCALEDRYRDVQCDHCGEATQGTSVCRSCREDQEPEIRADGGVQQLAADIDRHRCSDCNRVFLSELGLRGHTHTHQEDDRDD